MHQSTCAKVSKRLLQKADRLFTGTLAGRIIEILQNARRADTTEVTITNEDGLVTVHDNGKGIEDFSKLLDLGDSDWDQALEKAEDPAGVGIFCLAPRKVTICSNGRKLVITKNGWTGKSIELTKAQDSGSGTSLTFADEPWELEKVQIHAVFSGLKVNVNGKKCAQQRFVSSKAVLYRELGCKIEICERSRLGQWHQQCRDRHYRDDVLVNFHGQVTMFSYEPVSEHLRYLVDMTDDPTGIRMMLPARTQLIENKALEALKAAIEKEAYRFIAKRGKHRLPYKEYLRTAELGIELPEAEPVFDEGTLTSDMPEPIEIIKPENFRLSKCYRMNQRLCYEDEHHAANIHLLAALGKFDEPFVPVTIAAKYDGYTWAKLPTIDKLEVTLGKKLGASWILSQMLTAVESIRVAAHTSDGRVFESDVLMAVMDAETNARPWCSSDHVYVTPGAHGQLSTSDIWYHFGGWNEDGDTYDTQEYEFEEGLELFWSSVIGPGEYVRAKIVGCLDAVKGNWQNITIDSDRTVVISYKDGSKQTLKSPFADNGKS